jgi:hypothetical protein
MVLANATVPIEFVPDSAWDFPALSSKGMLLLPNAGIL